MTNNCFSVVIFNQPLVVTTTSFSDLQPTPPIYNRYPRNLSWLLNPAHVAMKLMIFFSFAHSPAW